MRVLQASPAEPAQAIRRAGEHGCEAVAWDLRDNTSRAVVAAERAGLRSEGWLQVARDPEAARTHPEWMHCPQHHEWLRRFPDYTGGHPALVAPYIGLNTRPAFRYAVARATELITCNPWASRVWLADLQGPPMGCGCGNPCCRSWDNAPGEKLAPTPYEHPATYFPLEFVRALERRLREKNLPVPALITVLCPECERGITLDGVEDPDGPDGTDLCQGIPCVRPCALDYWPGLLHAFRGAGYPVGLLLMTDALGKNHPMFGEPRGWPKCAHRHYGTDLIPCVEPEDAANFDGCLILTDAPQECWPVAPPEGYVAEVPPIMCGYCPPAG